MTTYAITGDDTFLLNSRVLDDLTDGSVVTINYDNDRIGLSTGKNGTTVFADNRQGVNGTVELRVLIGSGTDKYLNGLSIQQENDTIGFSLLGGVFSKRIGDGNGNVQYVRYSLAGGMFSKFPDTQENNTGDTEQGTVVYTIKFANISRVIS